MSKLYCISAYNVPYTAYTTCRTKSNKGRKQREPNDRTCTFKQKQVERLCLSSINTTGLFTCNISSNPRFIFKNINQINSIWLDWEEVEILRFVSLDFIRFIVSLRYARTAIPHDTCIIYTTTMHRCAVLLSYIAVWLCVPRTLYTCCIDRVCASSIIYFQLPFFSPFFALLDGCVSPFFLSAIPAE